MDIIWLLLPNGGFFMFPINFHQILEIIVNYGHKFIKYLSLLIVVISIHHIWMERSARVNSNSFRSIFAMVHIIRRVVAYRLWRWKFKDS